MWTLQNHFQTDYFSPANVAISLWPTDLGHAWQTWAIYGNIFAKVVKHFRHVRHNYGQYPMDCICLWPFTSKFKLDLSHSHNKTIPSWPTTGPKSLQNTFLKMHWSCGEHSASLHKLLVEYDFLDENDKRSCNSIYPHPSSA